MPNLNPPAVSQARQPRGLVKVNGALLPGWISWEVNNNTYYEADSFRVTFSLKLLPADRSDSWWSSQSEIFIEIFAGFPSNPDQYAPTDLMSLIYGRVDEIVYNPVARSLEVSGRDLTAAFIDTKTTETFQNLTASGIATQLALRHGLTPIVTATKQRVGKYYQLDKNIVNQQRTEWDMLTGLAGQEQFVVYVKGQELHFEPPVQNVIETSVIKYKPTQTEIDAQQARVDAAKTALDAQVAKNLKLVDQTNALLAQYSATPTPELRAQLIASQAAMNAANAEAHAVQQVAYDAEVAKLKTLRSMTDTVTLSSNAYILKWEAPTVDNGAYKFNGKTLHFRRALNLARGVVVIVQSISPKTGQVVKAIFPQKAAGVKPGQSTSTAQVYQRTIANLTYEDALKKAQALHRDISQHEVKLDATLPADNILGVKNLIQVTGTGTSFDQTYYPDSITRTMDISTGYSMTINAKNHSPESVVAL